MEPEAKHGLSRFDDSSLIKKNEDFERRLKTSAPVAREIAKLVEEIMDNAGFPIRLEPRGYGALSEKHYSTGIKAEALPDFVAKSVDGDADLARIDAKGKSRMNSAGFVNIRDAVKYVRAAIDDGLPVFVCSLVDPNCARDGDVTKIRATAKNTFFANLLGQDVPALKIKQQWDGNWTFTLRMESVAVLPDALRAALGHNQSTSAKATEAAILERLSERRIRLVLD